MEFLCTNQQNEIQLPRLAFTTPFQQLFFKKEQQVFLLCIVGGMKNENGKIPIFQW